MEAVARLFPTPPLPGLRGVHWTEGGGVPGGADPDPELPPPSPLPPPPSLCPPSLPRDPWGLRSGLSTLVPAPQEPGSLSRLR